MICTRRADAGDGVPGHTLNKQTRTSPGPAIRGRTQIAPFGCGTGAPSDVQLAVQIGGYARSDQQEVGYGLRPASVIRHCLIASWAGAARGGSGEASYESSAR